MHSKWKVWDYLKNYPMGHDPSQTGICAFYSHDPFITSLIKGLFPKKNFHESKLPMLYAKELSSRWFEDNFLTLGLFGNLESYVIKNAEQLSQNIKDLILSEKMIVDNRYLFLFFDKNDDFFKTLNRQATVNTVEIQPPAFWEFDKLLDFLADYLKVALSFEAKNSILSNVENTPLSFYNLLTRLSVNFGQNTISLDNLEDVLEKSRIDNFELVTLFGFKKMKEFYKKLIDVEPDHESLRSLFYFLQTHILKLSDPSYIYEKNRQTKYDKQIISQCKVWKPHELDQVMAFLKSLESKAKLKSPFLKEEIRSAYFRAII